MLQLLQVVEVRLAIWAADFIEVEADVIEKLWVPCLQQITAELITGRATDSFASPDRADGVLPAIFQLQHVC